MAEVKEKSWAKVKDLRAYHQPLLESLGVPDALYLPKMFYTPSGKSELHVSFFRSELQRGKDIYTEMVDREFNSEDSHRILYRWNYNELWATQYQETGAAPIRYLVPVKELEVVKLAPTLFDDTQGSENSLYECSDEDCPMSEMTMRDLAALYLKVPVSLKPWLNEAIRKGGGS